MKYRSVNWITSKNFIPYNYDSVTWFSIFCSERYIVTTVVSSSLQIVRKGYMNAVFRINAPTLCNAVKKSAFFAPVPKMCTINLSKDFANGSLVFSAVCGGVICGPCSNT